MEIIRDYNTALEKIEEALNKMQETGLLKYVKVDKVKIRNKITKKQEIIKDLFFVSFGTNSSNPIFIRGIADYNTKKAYILHDDFDHYNMGYGAGTADAIKRDKDCNYQLFYKNFCNPVKQIHIWDNPDAAEKILKGNLLEGNPNDSYRTPKSTKIDMYIPQLYTVDNSALKSDATLEQIITRYWDINDCHNIEALANYKTITDILRKDKNACYARVANAYNIDLKFNFEIIDKKHLTDGEYIVDDYYKVFTADDIDSEHQFSKQEKDVCCIGLGSSGANILMQLCRLDYFKTYSVIDYDNVEMKNLRNQPYRRSDIGEYKANAITSEIYACSTLEDITIHTENKKFEEASVLNLLKYKYLISAFDSIECRLELLNKAINNEIETQYLIDARYNNLDSSLFFINMSNKAEVEYYKKLLEEDLEEFKKQEESRPKNYEWNDDEVEQWAHDNKVIEGGCSRMATKLGYHDDGDYDNICYYTSCGKRCNCGRPNCIEAIKKALLEKHIENTVNINSCIKKNYIHIYTLTSSYVTSAIRSIETEGVKPFTHVDITADPMPNAIILKK